MSWIMLKQIPPGKGNWYAYQYRSEWKNGRSVSIFEVYLGPTSKPKAADAMKTMEVRGGPLTTPGPLPETQTPVAVAPDVVLPVVAPPSVGGAPPPKTNEQTAKPRKQGTKSARALPESQVPVAAPSAQTDRIQRVRMHPQAPEPQSARPAGVGKPKASTRPARREHAELQEVIAEMGRKLGRTVETERGVDYEHDVLWKDNPYKLPSHVWEICDRGNLDKDVAALTAAADPKKWAAMAILVVTGDHEYSSAKRKLADTPVLVVRSEVVKQTAELVNSGDIDFLQSIFSSIFS